MASYTAAPRGAPAAEAAPAERNGFRVYGLG